MLDIFFLIVIFIIGASVGSFTSVVIYRLHSKKKGILKGRSFCPTCETKLSAFDLVPILSYLTLRGKCRYCDKEISYMYPLLELISGLIFVLFFIKFPFIDSSLIFHGINFGLFLLYSFYSFVLIFTFFFDLHYLKIADEILLPAIIVGLVATIAYPYTPHIWNALFGCAIAVLFFSAQILLSRGKWLGMGDIRVGAFMGVILGWKLTILAIFLAYIIGSLVAIFVIIKNKRFFGLKVPFAPMLVSGTFITLFVGKEIVDWYLAFLGF